MLGKDVKIGQRPTLNRWPFLRNATGSYRMTHLYAETMTQCWMRLDHKYWQSLVQRKLRYLMAHVRHPAGSACNEGVSGQAPQVFLHL